MIAKRYRALKAKPGEIKIAWGREDRYNLPDLCVAWGDGIDMKCTARLIMNAIGTKTLHAKFPGTGHEYRPSLLEELESRGFDITTLRIEIRRKETLDGYD